MPKHHFFSHSEDHFIVNTDSGNICVTAGRPDVVRTSCESYDEELAAFLKKPPLPSRASLGLDHDIQKQADNEVGINDVDIMLSGTCNLRCTYCYVMPENPCVQGVMSKETIDRFLEFLVPAMGPKPLVAKFSILGGEPFLHTEKLRYLLQGLVEATEHVANPEIHITTNGTILDDSIIRLLHDFPIELSVSIDGPATVHDACRKFQNSPGKSTHAVILDNIDALVAEHFDNTNIHLTSVLPLRDPTTIVDALDFFVALTARYGEAVTHSGFAEPYFTKDTQPPPPPDEFGRLVDVLYSRFAAKILEILIATRDISFLSWFPADFVGKILASQPAEPFACAAGYHRITLLPDGRLGSCLALLHPTMVFGSVYPPAEINEEIRSIPTNRSVLFPREPAAASPLTDCCTCIAAWHCGGQVCRARNFNLSGTLSSPGPYHCTSLRAIFRASVWLASRLVAAFPQWPDLSVEEELQ